MPTDLKALARIGAQTRIAQLHSELSAIYKTFPDLRTAASMPAERSNRKAKRQRRNMSAAQKRAVSARMKKYWAERRKAESKAK